MTCCDPQYIDMPPNIKSKPEVESLGYTESLLKASLALDILQIWRELRFTRNADTKSAVWDSVGYQRVRRQFAALISSK